MAIQFLDALAGSGKTHALSRYAIRLSRAGERVLFVQPSKQLIDATIRDELQGQRRQLIRAIHGDNTTGVVQEIVDCTRACNVKPGQILLITHEAFMRLPHLEDKRDWHLIFDEVPAADIYKSFDIPETHGLITRSLRFEPSDAAYGIIAADPAADITLEQIAKNERGDEVWAQFGPLAHRVLSRHWDVFALQSNYHGLVAEDSGVRRLITHSLLKPSIFEGYREVLIASALFTHSALYKLWQAQRMADFQPVSEDIRSELQYHQHDNGSLLTVRYLGDLEWSKSLRDKAITFEEQETTLKAIIPRLIGDALLGERFAWMGNKDIPDDYFNDFNAIRLPNAPHGLNGFQHLHHVVICAALNAPPAHFKFINSRGVSPEELRTANYRLAVYQATMRISLRNPRDRTPKSITVMDAGTAHWLGGLFPGASVQAMESRGLAIPCRKPGRPRLHENRAKVHRRKKRYEKLLNSFCQAGEGSTPTFGTAYASLQDSKPLLFLDAADAEGFIDLLREIHARSTPSKEENFLLSPAHFIPDLPEVDTHRGIANIQHVNGIWLDNDGGELTHQAFAALLPQLRIVVWNTYSSTRHRPRWRCFIPTTSVMSADTYASVVSQIMVLLRDHGYGSQAGQSLRQHGFDPSKYTAASIYYAPCQAACREDSFFLDYADGLRIPLDVEQWLENEIAVVGEPDAWELEDSASSSAPYAGTLDDLPGVPQMRTALDSWRRAPLGNGNIAFFGLALELRRCGLSREEAQKTLLAEAQHARSPGERVTEVRGIINRCWGR